MHAQGRDALVRQQLQADCRLAELGLVARCRQVGDGQAATLHGQIDGEVGALRQNGHAALHRRPAVLVGPQRHSIQIVDEAVAVWPDEGQVSRRLQQGLLQFLSGLLLLGGFGEAGGEADRAAGLHCRQRRQNFHGGLAVDGDEAGVRAGRQTAHLRVGRQPRHFRPMRMHRPNLAPIAGPLQLPDHIGRPSAAEDRHRARPEQTGQVSQGGPS